MFVIYSDIDKTMYLSIDASVMSGLFVFSSKVFMIFWFLECFLIEIKQVMST